MKQILYFVYRDENGVRRDVQGVVEAFTGGAGGMGFRIKTHPGAALVSIPYDNIMRFRLSESGPGYNRAQLLSYFLNGDPGKASFFAVWGVRLGDILRFLCAQYARVRACFLNGDPGKASFFAVHGVRLRRVLRSLRAQYARVHACFVPPPVPLDFLPVSTGRGAASEAQKRAIRRFGLEPPDGLDRAAASFAIHTLQLFYAVKSTLGYRSFKGRPYYAALRTAWEDPALRKYLEDGNARRWRDGSGEFQPRRMKEYPRLAAIITAARKA